MADIFSTDTLNRIVRDLRRPQTGMLDAYFPASVEHETEEIHFDVETRRRRLAPFVSPLREGKIVEGQGFVAKTFKPAYVKDKRVFTPNRALKRAMGERIGGGELSPQQRIDMMVAQDLEDQVDMINRRMEWMACSALRTGTVTVVGEGYPSTLVDFGRDAALTVTLSGGARWGQAGVKPLDSLQDWVELPLQKSGALAVDVNMTVDVWKVFRNDADIKTRLDRFRGNSTLAPDAKLQTGRVFMGVVDQFSIYVYSDWYDDENGVQQPMLPANTVIMTSPQIEGTREYGAIMDLESLRAQAYFSKSWNEQDPSVRYLLMQSAPLVVPNRVNAALAASVL